MKKVCTLYAYSQSKKLAFTALFSALCLFLKKIIKKDKLDFLVRLISAVFAEVFMVLGYFLFESHLYGFGGATLALTGNLLQGGCCLIIATAIFSALYLSHATKKFLINLHTHKDF